MGSKAVERKGDDSRGRADASEKWHGNQEAEESKAGDGLDDVGGSEHPATKRGAAHQGDSEWNADEYGNGHGGADQAEVFESAGEDFGAIGEEETQQGHVVPPRVRRRSDSGRTVRIVIVFVFGESEARQPIGKNSSKSKTAVIPSAARDLLFRSARQTARSLQLRVLVFCVASPLRAISYRVARSRSRPVSSESTNARVSGSPASRNSAGR